MGAPSTPTTMASSPSTSTSTRRGRRGRARWCTGAGATLRCTTSSTYATTLERLDLSSPHSRARAAAMGILLSRKPRAGETTPVLVSVDVTRRRGRLRLDGIVRTVITLGCYSHPSSMERSFRGKWQMKSGSLDTTLVVPYGDIALLCCNRCAASTVSV